jgi:Arc/MetJ-type ribon-helix-helix transcriptional regulator
MSRAAQQLAREEHRTKSELIREALRLYFAQRGQPLAIGASERLSRVGELAALYQQHHPTRTPSEAELRDSFRGVRKLHDRLKHLA